MKLDEALEVEERMSTKSNSKLVDY